MSELANSPAPPRKTSAGRILLIVFVAVTLLCLGGTAITVIASGGDDIKGAAHAPSATGVEKSAAAAITPAQGGDHPLIDQIGSLTVAAEDRTGYDRDLFGDYDRPALLKQNFSAWPDCNGYYSLADNQCYKNAGELDVDHIVALGEAWDSGASKWTPAQRTQYAGDAANLWLMTDSLNQSKGDEDAAEWLPPYGTAVCGYVKAYVAVKAEWQLSVDQAEKAALIKVAQGC